MNTMVEDDQSSVHSFAAFYDYQNSKEADDYKVTESDTNESFHGESCELSSHLRPNEQSPQENVDEPSNTKLTVQEQPSVMEVTKVMYKDSFIRVYTDTISPRNIARCFYHEPLVVLDRKTIELESCKFLKKDLVRFKIKMWDAEIRAKVLERLRSLPSLKNEGIHEEDVHVMPYEEVQLKVEPGSLISSIKLKSESIPYIRLRESLNFQFDCASSTVAVELAENLKKNPERFVEEWKLALECRGLSLSLRTGTRSVNGSLSKKLIERPIWLFNVSTHPCRTFESDSIVNESLMDSLLPRLEGYDKEVKGLKAMIESAKNLFIETSQKIREHSLLFTNLQNQIKVVSNKKPALCVPVFSVENCTNPSAARGGALVFSTFVMKAKTQHGDFDLPTGIYAVKTAGNYLLNFSGHVEFEKVGGKPNRFNLKVNNKTVAISHNHSDASGDQPTAISVLLPLDANDKVGIFTEFGKLFDYGHFKTRFFGILLLDPSTDE